MIKINALGNLKSLNDVMDKKFVSDIFVYILFKKIIATVEN